MDDEWRARVVNEVWEKEITLKTKHFGDEQNKIVCECGNVGLCGGWYSKSGICDEALQIA